MPDGGARYETDVLVPCNVEPYLVSLGLVDDYQPADDPYRMQIFEAVDDWTYTVSFDSEPTDGDAIRELVFEGIDTIAEVYLNGERILDCQNMHLTYRVDVTNRLMERGNTLQVIIRSSELWAREHLHDMATTSRDAATLYDSQSHLRKPRHQWGWDNAPRLLTSGIVRSVYLEERPRKRFEEVYLYTDFINEKSVQIGVNWIYKTDRRSLADHFFRFTLLDGEETVFTHTGKLWFVQGTLKYRLDRERVALWWSCGFGEAKRYTARLEMLEGERVVASHEEMMGIRTLDLDWSEEITGDGGDFVFRINGERVHIRGTNWKPLDPLVSIADKRLKTEQALDELVSLGCNMVRVWGGGMYEDPFFYDYCDRHGIMVWQDFMLACELSATDDFYCAMIDEEARQVIRRYRNHPSLAVWCGDNENDQCMNWVNRFAKTLPSENRISREILRRAVRACDPYRTYVPSSPFVSDRSYREQIAGRVIHAQAEEHFYPPMTEEKRLLRACKSRFLGETGPIEANAIACNAELFARESARAERLWNEEPFRVCKEMNMHQSEYYFKVWRRAGRLACEAFYGRDFAFSEFRDYTLALNFLCAEIFKDIIEYCRAMRWEKTGVLWWSLMDMFPMLFNYSVIDCRGGRKLPYYWIRQSQRTVAMACVRREQEGEITLYGINDTLSEASITYTVEAYDEYGNVQTLTAGDCRLEANGSAAVATLDGEGAPRLLIVTWERDGVTHKNHMVTGACSFETMREWVRIIGRECGFLDEIAELKEKN